MKRAAAILMILAMVSLWQQAFGEFDPASAFAPGQNSDLWSGNGIKKMEDKFAGDLAALTSEHRSKGGINPGNSSLENSSINASQPQNSSLNTSLSGSEDNSTLSGKLTEVNDSEIKAGSSIDNRFKGFYATRASRHEIGKGGVDSSISLRGEFEMDKSIKFQDRGF